MTVYPIGIDTSIELPDVVDAVTAVNSITINKLRDAILAIESELGVHPASNYTTVASRLDNIDSMYGTFAQEISSLQTRVALLEAGGGSAAPFVASGDLSGNLLSQTVVGIQGKSVSSATPSANDALVFDGTQWGPGTVNSFSAGGDLTGSNSSQTVVGINGASVPASGALTTGNVLSVTSASTLSYGPINLAGGSNYVTGILPSANQGAQTMGADVTGTTASATVVALRGFSLATSSPATGNFLAYNGTNWAPTTLYFTRIFQFYGGTASTTSTSWNRIATFSIDMSLFPATIAGMSRTVIFEAEIESSIITATTSVRLWDTTSAVAITSSTLDNSAASSKVLSYYVSANLTVGTSSGNINSSARHIYELQLTKTAGATDDRAIVTGARIVITYA